MINIDVLGIGGIRWRLKASNW